MHSCHGQLHSNDRLYLEHVLSCRFWSLHLCFTKECPYGLFCVIWVDCNIISVFKKAQHTTAHGYNQKHVAPQLETWQHSRTQP